MAAVQEALKRHMAADVARGKVANIMQDQGIHISPFMSLFLDARYGEEVMRLNGDKCTMDQKMVQLEVKRQYSTELAVILYMMKNVMAPGLEGFKYDLNGDNNEDDENMAALSHYNAKIAVRQPSSLFSFLFPALFRLFGVFPSSRVSLF